MESTEVEVEAEEDVSTTEHKVEASSEVKEVVDDKDGEDEKEMYVEVEEDAQDVKVDVNVNDEDEARVEADEDVQEQEVKVDVNNEDEGRVGVNDVDLELPPAILEEDLGMAIASPTSFALQSSVSTLASPTSNFLSSPSSATSSAFSTTSRPKSASPQNNQQKREKVYEFHNLCGCSCSVTRKRLNTFALLLFLIISVVIAGAVASLVYTSSGESQGAN